MNVQIASLRLSIPVEVSMAWASAVNAGSVIVSGEGCA
jgi:hypothetical protein